MNVEKSSIGEEKNSSISEWKEFSVDERKNSSLGEWKESPIEDYWDIRYTNIRNPR